MPLSSVRPLVAQQRPGDQQVRIAGRLRAEQVPGGVRMVAEKPAGQLEVIVGPLPDTTEDGRFVGDLCQQQAVCLALADRVIALVRTGDPAIGPDIGCQECGG